MSDAPPPHPGPELEPAAAEPQPEPGTAQALAPATAPRDPGATIDLALQVTLAVGGGFAIFVFYQLVMLACLGVLPGRLRSGLAISQLVGLLLPTLAALALARRTGWLPAARPRARVSPGIAAGVLIWTSCNALILLALMTSSLAVVAPHLLRRLQDFMGQMYEPLFRLESPLDVAGILLVVTIVPAVCEETLFRGFVQRVLRGRLSAAWAIGISSVLFAGVHAEPLGFLSRVAIGVGLGVAYERTGSLRLPMIIHAAHNLISSLLFSWEMTDAEIPARGEAILMLVGAMPALFLAMFLWWRALRALPRAEAATAPGPPATAP
jgi:membrane protease YdiL (CAAX protease family)